jgi:L-xylulose reductase
MEITFAGKRALVTGASKGIGRDIALALAKCKARVAIMGRDEKDLLKLKTEISKFNANANWGPDYWCTTIVADLADAEQARHAAEAAVAEGPVDLLVNNAGVAHLEPFLETKVENWDHTMNVNVRAVYIVSQVVARHLVARKAPGAIVNISSQASMIGVRDHAAYCASKGALDQLTRVMALELGQHNIRVNCVNPTVVMTDMGKKNWSDPEKAKTMLSSIPLGRFADVREVTDAVLFLLSDRASCINGVMLPIDGGFLATR